MHTVAIDDLLRTEPEMTLRSLKMHNTGMLEVTLSNGCRYVNDMAGLKTWA